MIKLHKISKGLSYIDRYAKKKNKKIENRIQISFVIYSNIAIVVNSINYDFNQLKFN